MATSLALRETGPDSHESGTRAVGQRVVANDDNLPLRRNRKGANWQRHW